MWQNLEDLEKSKKVIVILIGLMLMYIVTNIVFGICKGTINYENVEMKINVGKIIVRLFTGLNVFFIPIAIKNIMKVKNGEQDENTFKIAGSVPISELKKILNVEIPEGEYDTLSGFLTQELGRIPEDGEKPIIETKDVTYKIEDYEDKRILWVKACKNGNAEDNQDAK